MALPQEHGKAPDIVRAAYAELVVTDLAEARQFYVDLLGFVVSARTPAMRCTCAGTTSSPTTT